MGDPYPYGIPDFRHLPAEPPCLGAAAPPNSYDVVFSHDYYDPSSSMVFATNPIATNNTIISNNNSIEEKGGGWVGFDAAPNNRWPRQETLSLLEIRSRLDSMFRHTNHKVPLWNQISRIMEEEYGYSRSGKKCKEKFENLYKYYKKTKEGKAGRQDGKHYRFFRQLEAICGGSSSQALLNTTSPNYHTAPLNIKDGTQLHHHHHNNLNKCCSNSLSFSNNSSSDQIETSSSDENNNNNEDLSAIAYMMKQKGIEIEEEHHRVHEHDGRFGRRSSGKVEELVESHMRKIMESQEAWMEKMMSVVEQREQEIMVMVNKEEEEMRKKRSDSSMRLDRQMRELRAKEGAWIEARDAALMEVMKKKKHLYMGRKELEEEEEAEKKNKDNIVISSSSGHGWTELEISNLIQLRTSFEVRFHEGVWDEIAAKMSCLGFNRSANECKQIWSEISASLPTR